MSESNKFYLTSEKGYQDVVAPSKWILEDCLWAIFMTPKQK